MLLSIKTPRQDGEFLSGRGRDWGLIETDAGYGGGFDGVGMVVLLF